VTGTIYGGQTVNGTAAGHVHSNLVQLVGGNINAAIYGGYSARATATNNTVVIDGAATMNRSDVYGGYVMSGGGDAFTGNILHKNTDAELGTVQNFQFVNFNYSGNANIDTLYTTATGSAASGIILNTAGNDINFGGYITGMGDMTKIGNGVLWLTGGSNYFHGGLTLNQGAVSFTDANQLKIGSGNAITFNGAAVDGYSTLRFDGDDIILDAKIIFESSGYLHVDGGYSPATLTTAITGNAGSNMYKSGTGTLVLAADNNTLADQVVVQEGTLQIGNGSTTGSVSVTTGGIFVNTDAALAYNRSDLYWESQEIHGSGKVIQRGIGALMLTGANTFTGGTEIERGQLNVVNNYSYGQANGLDKFGYITFTGDDTNGAKTVAVDVPGALPMLNNTFRTEIGAGHENYVDLTGTPVVLIGGNNIGDKGGAFYVAGGTSMTVDADALVLGYNIANGSLNDLYVESGGTFNLNVGGSFIRYDYAEA
jgi:autotransporter-associated beta strand protein